MTHAPLRQAAHGGGWGSTVLAPMVEISAGIHWNAAGPFSEVGIDGPSQRGCV